MSYVVIIAAAFLIAVCMGRIIIPKILIISLRKRLYDAPDSRKVHKRPISRLGGVSFFPVILFTLSFVLAVCKISGVGLLGSQDEELEEFLLFSSGLTLLYIIGIADDLVGVRYRKKFLVQIIAAAMFPLAGLYVNDFYGLIGVGTLAPYVGIPITLLLVVFITNAINLIDGIDGLASGLSMVALLVYGGIFAWCGQWIYTLLSFVVIGVLFPFFYFNVFGNADRGRKIFMGDTGSLTLGFILSFLTIKLVMNKGTLGLNSESAIMIAFSVLMIPCLDVVRVVLKRLRNKRALFMPDQTHIHHKFLAMGFTARRAMITILLMSLSFCAFNMLLLPYVNNTLLVVVDVVVWTGLNLWFDWVMKKKLS